MTLTTTIYNTAGWPFTIDFEFEIEGNVVTIIYPKLDKHFGDGWQDDLVKALHELLDFDFELKII